VRHDRIHYSPIVSVLYALGAPGRSPQGRLARPRRRTARRPGTRLARPPAVGFASPAVPTHWAALHRARPPVALLCPEAPQGVVVPGAGARAPLQLDLPALH